MQSPCAFSLSGFAGLQAAPRFTFSVPSPQDAIAKGLAPRRVSNTHPAIQTSPPRRHLHNSSLEGGGHVDACAGALQYFGQQAATCPDARAPRPDARTCPTQPRIPGCLLAIGEKRDPLLTGAGVSRAWSCARSHTPICVAQADRRQASVPRRPLFSVPRSRQVATGCPPWRDLSEGEAAQVPQPRRPATYPSACSWGGCG